MQQENVLLYNPAEDMEDDLNINFEKLWKVVWSRKVLLINVFCSVLAFFILLTFIMPKKYTVTADLYINKSNNSNMMEVNPYFLDEASGQVLPMGADKAISNEIELIKSELVLDKVIRDNNIVYKKIFGIFPNKKEGEFLTAEAFYKKGKILKIDNTKNTNVITIEYTAKKPELAYGVVSSLIANYIDLHKELNTEKSKSDTKLLEAEYKKIKEDLNKRLNQASGLPVQSMTGIGNLSAMSAFSKSASQAMGSIKSQYVAGEKSQIAVSEESQKLTQLAAKLEWAKMVELMSDSSKVLVLKEPKQLRPFENSSPKLLINIILGCVFGYLSALSVLIYVETKDKKLVYSALTNNIIYDGMNNPEKINAEILGYKPRKVLLVSLVKLPQGFVNKLQEISNAEFCYADITEDFIDKVIKSDQIMLISQIQVTNRSLYTNIQQIVKKQNKTIAYDILV